MTHHFSDDLVADSALMIFRCDIFIGISAAAFISRFTRESAPTLASRLTARLSRRIAALGIYFLAAR